jgi:hypothetical protein
MQMWYTLLSLESNMAMEKFSFEDDLFIDSSVA